MKQSTFNEAIRDMQDNLQHLQLSMGTNTVYDQALVSLQQDLNAILQKMEANQATPNQQQVEQIRIQFAHLRNQIQQVVEDLDGSVDASLHQYRSTLGDQKDQFEALLQTDQQLANPVAYSALQTYRQEQEIRDLLTQLNGSLMAVSTNLELQSKDTGPAPAATNTNFDSDPAPHHLSP